MMGLVSCQTVVPMPEPVTSILQPLVTTAHVNLFLVPVVPMPPLVTSTQGLALMTDLVFCLTVVLMRELATTTLLPLVTTVLVNLLHALVVQMLPLVTSTQQRALMTGLVSFQTVALIPLLVIMILQLLVTMEHVNLALALAVWEILT